MRIKRGDIIISTDDIIGKRSGKLTVVSYAGYKRTLTKGGEKVRHYYICKCDCGSLHVTQRGALKNGVVHSCGCKRRKRYD